MVKDDTRVETGNDDDDNKSVNEIGDKENSVCENVVDRLETGNDDDDNKSVDEMRDKENSLCEKGVVGTEIGNGHGGTSGETGNNVREQELDDVKQGSISHGASTQPITNIYEDISADETGEIENSDGKKDGGERSPVPAVQKVAAQTEDHLCSDRDHQPQLDQSTDTEKKEATLKDDHLGSDCDHHAQLDKSTDTEKKEATLTDDQLDSDGDRHAQLGKSTDNEKKEATLTDDRTVMVIVTLWANLRIMKRKRQK